MRIHTITTSYANNYGALLQCYALSKYINNLPDTECQVIQYYRPNYKRSWTIFKSPRNLRELLKMVYLLLNRKEYKARKRKNQAMISFLRNYIPFTKEKWMSPQEIHDNPPVADAFICGSDQIWNMKYMFEGKTVYFLDFVKKGKKIAYAPSIADPWKEEDLKLLIPYLKSFDAISIREKGNLAQVQQVYPEATVVIDPVFLLDRNEWKQFMNTTLCLNEPYILCYFLSVSDLAVKTVRKIRELTGLKVVHLNLNALDKFHSDYNIRVADPRDFVGLISHATLLCTNSFHCSAFSVIFNKDFVFVPKNMANERVTNLQDVFRLGNVCIDEHKLQKLTLKDLRIDYTKGKTSGEEFIKYSKSFLKESLYGKEYKPGEEK